MIRFLSIVIPGNVRKLHMWLGWDTKCDLDASAILMGQDGRVHDVVFYGNKQSKCNGLIHMGDNLTGEGDGDDETILIDLDKIHPSVFCVVFTVNVFTAGKSFADVEGEFCRLVDESNYEICRYNTLDNGSHNAALFCALFRDMSKPDWWKMVAVGQWGHGRVARDLVPAAQGYMYRIPGSTAAAPRTPPPQPIRPVQPPQQHQPQQKKPKKSCEVM